MTLPAGFEEMPLELQFKAERQNQELRQLCRTLTREQLIEHLVLANNMLYKRGHTIKVMAEKIEEVRQHFKEFKEAFLALKN